MRTGKRRIGKDQEQQKDELQRVTQEEYEYLHHKQGDLAYPWFISNAPVVTKDDYHKWRAGVV